MGQKMSDLPEFRLNPAFVMEDAGVDLLGPYLLKRGRVFKKYWVGLFRCMRTGAVVLDLIEDLTSTSFINSLFRFHSRFPTLKCLHSDNGTNLRGADNELKKLTDSFNNDIAFHLRIRRIGWKFIAPDAPHTGGIWERPVGIAKKLFEPFFHGRGSLDADGFRTILEAVAGMW